VENGKGAACGNSVTISETELKNRLCDELDMAEYDEQAVKDNIESITVSVDGFNFEIREHLENSLIL